MVLNLRWLSMNFLCLDQPMVIKTKAMMFVNGCSTANKRAGAFNPLIPKVWMALSPLPETKYRISPINN